MKKMFLALAALATLTFTACEKKSETTTTNTEVPSEVICQYGDTIVAHDIMPGYTDYLVTVDGEEHAFIEGDTVFVACIGNTTMHVEADQKVKKDIALTIVPRLPEEFMFTIPAFDWTRTRNDVLTEVGTPNNRIGPDAELRTTDSVYVYYLDGEKYNQFAYYYFTNDSDNDFNTLSEIVVSIMDEEHGEVLKLFIAERFPFFGKAYSGSIPVWIYYDAPKKSDATTMIRYYRTSAAWNVAFSPKPVQ